MPDSRIAYFSMEIGLEADMPTYSGGLGILAGDTLRAVADRGGSMVAVTLVHRKGYFKQTIDAEGGQSEEPDTWSVADHLREMEPRVEVEIEGKPVAIRCWCKEVVGELGDKVLVYFLDTDVEQNDARGRSFTDSLYGGDEHYRLAQELILGVGGVRMLEALGYDKLTTYHLNEGHAALLTVELIERRARRAGRDAPTSTDVDAIRERCVFTTHTPVAAGHDRFEVNVVERVIGEELWRRMTALCPMEQLNMTELALRHSRYVNGVARRHGEVTRDMFDGVEVDAITNGVHAKTWSSPAIRELFDRHLPAWRVDNQSLRYLIYSPLAEIVEAHQAGKRALLEEIERTTGIVFDPKRFTIGFARRATAYKRGDMLFRDIERLNRIAEEAGPIQIVFAGKAHPHDENGKQIIRNIVAARKRLSDRVGLVYLANYGMRLGGLLTAGCDVWLNNPEPPKEASGTSGMKAALNGVPSLSVLDGWWLEAHIEGVTGWSIDGSGGDSESLYAKLESTIVPLYYDDPDGYARIRRYAICLNGAFFNTERMVSEYARQAYRLTN